VSESKFKTTELVG